jgi:2-isopropylmalate synthase
MRPEDVGFAKTDLVLGKHSGRAALADRAATLGYPLEGDRLQEVFDEFKKLADKKKEVYDADIVALIERRKRIDSSEWTLVDYHVEAGHDSAPKASVKLSRGGETIEATANSGDGPLDALFIALEQATGITTVVRDFQVHSVTMGKDAQGESTIEAESGGRLYRGRGVSTDTVEASVLAFLNVLNRVAAGAGTAIEKERAV